MSEQIENVPENKLLKMTRCTADAECLRDVKPPYSFSASQYLGNAVSCTLSNGKDYKDWITDASVFTMWKHMIQHELIVTYNGLGFDYPLWGGSMYGADHMDARKFIEKSLKGKTIDLCKDFKDTLGQRVSLEDVAIPTLGLAKEMSGALAPENWRNGQCLEVISYCRGDVNITDRLFVVAASGEKLKLRLDDGTIREFVCIPKIR